MLRLQNNGKLGYFLMRVMADYRGFAQEMRAVIDQTRPKWELPLKKTQMRHESWRILQIPLLKEEGNFARHDDSSFGQLWS
jgi:hypothetical protein